MIEKLAKVLVKWQIKKKYLSESDESLYTYAYELLIGQVVNILIACLLAIIFHAYITVFIYLVTYIPLRSYAGGHHAESFNVCTFVSAMLIGIACILVKLIQPSYILFINIIGFLTSGLLLFLLSPVEDHNKPLDKAERVRYRRRSRGIWVIESALWLILYLAGYKKVSLAIILGHITLAFLLYLGIMKNKYLQRHKAI